VSAASFRVVLANPRGFCAGVVRAIDIVEVALAHFGAPIYVRHEVVHNRRVVEGLRARGTRFVESLSEVPDGAVVVFSAHGVARAVVDEARARDLEVFDATCPLVTKVHMQVARLARRGADCVVIGHRGHPEVEGTLGRFDLRHGGRVHLVEREADVPALAVRDPRQVGFVSQTTLSVDDTARIVQALRERFPDIAGPAHDDICYATQNRQDAVKALAGQCGLVLVVGSASSSNSNRLVEIARAAGADARLVDGSADIDARWLHGHAAVGVTAGASAPEDSVQEVVATLRALGGAEAQALPGVVEDVQFALPRALRLIARA
jgi:4-hydroxy-3-methylbut-2-enyl diphosphate reductase